MLAIILTALFSFTAGYFIKGFIDRKNQLVLDDKTMNKIN